jgi:hypothetical protein
MPVRRVFLHDARSATLEAIANWRQVAESWGLIRDHASSAGDAQRLAAAEEQLRECEKRIRAAEAKLADLDARIAEQPASGEA